MRNKANRRAKGGIEQPKWSEYGSNRMYIGQIVLFMEVLGGMEGCSAKICSFGGVGVYH